MSLQTGDAASLLPHHLKNIPRARDRSLELLHDELDLLASDRERREELRHARVEAGEHEEKPFIVSAAGHEGTELGVGVDESHQEPELSNLDEDVGVARPELLKRPREGVRHAAYMGQEALRGQDVELLQDHGATDLPPTPSWTGDGTSRA